VSNTIDPLEFLHELQSSEKTKNGFNTDLNAWVDDSSSVARALRRLKARMSAVTLLAWSASGEVAIYRDEDGTWLQTLGTTLPAPGGPADGLIKADAFGGPETFDSIEAMDARLEQIARTWLMENE
jgi:hypothetical protein